MAMTDNDKLVMLSKLVGEDEDVCSLSAYLQLAGDAIIQKAYPFATDKTVPDKYATLQVEIACYLYNKRGAEGETSHNENGINRTYESASVPDSMLKRVVPFCGVVQ